MSIAAKTNKLSLKILGAGAIVRFSTIDCMIKMKPPLQGMTVFTKEAPHKNIFVVCGGTYFSRVIEYALNIVVHCDSQLRYRCCHKQASPEE